MLLKPAASAPEPLHSANKVNVGHSENVPAPAAHSACENKDPQPRISDIPRVVLDMETISNAMAARLATSLLCHLLFLKSQIPFPVAQLSRLPGTQSDTKAGKKRAELMSAIDTLSSHLQTTFVALSKAVGESQKNPSNMTMPAGEEKTPSSRAYMTMVLGPSVGAAKARLMLGIDGLKLENRDKREDGIADGGDEAEDDEDGLASQSSPSDFEEDRDEGSSDSDSESHPEPPQSRSPSPANSRTPLPEPPQRPSFQIFTDNTDILSVPRSNTPPNPIQPAVSQFSPKVPPRSFTIFSDPPTQPGPSHTQSENAVSSSSRLSQPVSPTSTSLSNATKPHTIPSPQPLANKSILSPRSPNSTPTRTRSTAAPSKTHAEELQALRSADRLLSRTLANACAEENGGMSAELSPTQAHIFLRAPRRFAHPAWVPRQNLTRALEGHLQTFLEEASREHPSCTPKKAHRLGVKMEGVWIGCTGSQRATYEDLRQPTTVNEEDEMIWWQWDGKIVGFADW